MPFRAGVVKSGQNYRDKQTSVQLPVSHIISGNQHLMHLPVTQNLGRFHLLSRPYSGLLLYIYSNFHWTLFETCILVHVLLYEVPWTGEASSLSPTSGGNRAEDDVDTYPLDCKKQKLNKGTKDMMKQIS